MNRVLFVLAGIILFGMQHVNAQRCGQEQYKNYLINKDPSFAQKLEQQKQTFRNTISNYHAHPEDRLARTLNTTYYPIPVIFHFILDSDQLKQIGGTAGIQDRVDSQIVVLERDFNRQNADSVDIPDCFKPLYANIGIHFGLAGISPTGDSSTGYELRITTSTSFDPNDTSAKHTSSGGLDAWDVTKYINVWCINMGGGVLGLTLPQSFVNAGQGKENEKGIYALYYAVGKQDTLSGYYNREYNLGRTITHEMGHVFEIWHPWGDDGGLCPWGGGSDDGIADTPPQGNMIYGAPAFPFYDNCDSNGMIDEEPCGVILWDYMQYTDDSEMCLFTKDQSIVMSGYILPDSESFSLTQNPHLALPLPTNPIPPNTYNKIALEIMPNPSTGIVNVVYSDSGNVLQSISVINIVGQRIKQIQVTQPTNISFDLSELGKGIYFIQCNFASGRAIRKLLLE